MESGLLHLVTFVVGIIIGVLIQAVRQENRLATLETNVANIKEDLDEIKGYFAQLPCRDGSICPSKGD